jgi:hypothetical protein
VDVTGDGFLAPRDALNVINHLNRMTNAAAAPAIADLAESSSVSSESNKTLPIGDGRRSTIDAAIAAYLADDFFEDRRLFAAT